MADITPPIPAGRQLINAYGDGGFRIAGASYTGSVLVFPERTIPWPVDPGAELTVASLEAVLTAPDTPQVLLIGTGATTTFLPGPLRAALREKGIVAEPMATGAACRTFNVLLSEDRSVAAALIAPP